MIKLSKLSGPAVFGTAFLLWAGVAGASTVNFASVDFRTSGLTPGVSEALAIRDSGPGTCSTSQVGACTPTGATFETGTYVGAASSAVLTASTAPTLDGNGNPIAPLTGVQGIPISFQFDASTYPGIPAALQGNLNGHMYVKITTTAAGDHATGPASGSGTGLQQPFTTTGHLYITLDTPWDDPHTPGNDALYVLLSADFTGTLFGTGNSTGSLSAGSVDSTLVYRSQFLNFTNTVETDMAFSFSSATPCVSRKIAGVSGGCYSGTAGNYVRNFVASGNGQFGSDPRPILIDTIPEPMTLSTLGSALLGLAVVARRRISKARG